MARQFEPESSRRVWQTTELFSITSMRAIAGETQALVAGKKALRLVDLKSGNYLWQTESDVDHRAICVSKDGHTVLSAGHDGSVRRWDVNTGQCLSTTEVTTPGTDSWGRLRLTHLALNDDGSTFFAASENERLLWLWSIESGNCLAQFELPKSDTKYLAVLAVGFLDGNATALVSDGEGLRLWDDSSGSYFREFEGATQGVGRAVFSSDTRMALSGSSDNVIRLWNTETGKCEQSLRGHTRPILALRLGDDRKFALSHSQDKTVRFWEVATGRCLRTFHFNFDDRTRDVAWLDRRRQFLLEQGLRPQLWQVRTRQGHCNYQLALPTSAGAAHRTENQFQKLVDAARESTTSRDFGSAMAQLAEARKLPGCDRRPEAVGQWRELYQHLRRKSLRAVREDGSWSAHEPEHVSTISITADSSRIVTTGWAHPTKIKQWGMETGRCETTATAESFVPCATLSSDGDLLFCGGFSRSELYEIATGRKVQTFRGHSGYVSSVYLSPDSSWAITGGWDGTIRVWDVSTGQCLHTLGKQVESGNRSTQTPAAMTADGRYLISRLGTYDLSTLSLVSTATNLTSLTTMHAYDLDPTGRYTLCGRWSELSLWDTTTGNRVREFIKSEANAPAVNTVAFSSDGKLCLSGGTDRKIRIWETRTGTCLHTLSGHKTSVEVAGFSRDGKWIVSGDKGGTLIRWALDWELETTSQVFWDEAAEVFLGLFLTNRASDRNVPPSPSSLDRFRSSLTRFGQPSWTTADLNRLLHTLGTAGFGSLSAESVQIRLQQMAARWTGPPSPFPSAPPQPDAHAAAAPQALDPLLANRRGLGTNIPQSNVSPPKPSPAPASQATRASDRWPHSTANGAN